MREDLIETDNYIKLYEGLLRLKRLPKSAPRMGLAYGNYGLGKTNALDIIMGKENAIYLRAIKTWSKKTFLVDLSEEIGDIRKGTAHEMYKQVMVSLLKTPRILIIDEVDHLFNDRNIIVLETIRDLYDQTNIVVMFIGMEEAKAKFAKFKHYNSRISEPIFFTGITESDLRKLCSLSELIIEDDLIAFFLDKYSNLRHTKVLMERLEDWCEINGVDRVNLKTFKTSGVERGLGE